MSFTIQTNATSAFATRGAQDRHAHERPTGHTSPHSLSQRGNTGDSCDLSRSGKSHAADLREARHIQAHLNESLSFLQTQDMALGQIENLFVNANSHETFVESLQSLYQEKFNGLRLFSLNASEECVRISVTDNEKPVTIHCPHLPLAESAVCLHEAVLAAREQNHVDQDCIKKISRSATLQVEREAELIKIQGPESAQQTLAQSRLQFLTDAPTALHGQANAAHESVLRLFS